MTDAELREALPKVYGKPRFYRLRWRFDFANARSRNGVWNNASQNLKEMAAFISKNGLIRASIEGEKAGQGLARPLVEINGQDFASFSWEMAATVPMLGKNDPGRYQATGHVIGLSILSRSEKITVFIDGQVKRRALSVYEQGFNLEEHKQGG